MGMFDSLYDQNNDEWQTKAFGCNLDAFRVGHSMPVACADTYQVAILGELQGAFINSLATVRDNILVSIHDKRDNALPYLDYHGDLIDFDREAV